MADSRLSKNKTEWESHYDSVIPSLDFDKLGNFDRRVPYIKRLLEYGQGKKRSLEFGSGKGGLSLALKMTHPEVETHLLDFSTNALEYSRRLFAHFDLEGHFHEGSFLDLPFPDGHIDFIHGNTVLEHVRDTKRAVSELLRVLAPGGHILVTVPNRFRRYDAHDLYYVTQRLNYYSRTFYPSELKSLFTENSCEIANYFGDGFIFVFPSYIPKLVVEIARTKIFRKNHSGNTESTDLSRDESGAGPAASGNRLVRVLKNPMLIPDKLWYPVLIKLNRLVCNNNLFPASWSITIGVVAEKKR